MSMSREVWYARANAYVLRQLQLELSDLPYDWQGAYNQGTHWKAAAEEAVWTLRAELGFDEAADAYGKRVAEAQKTVGHVEGESVSDYMRRLVDQLRRLRPAEDDAPDAD